MAFQAATYLNLNYVRTTIFSILRRALAATVGADVGQQAIQIEQGGRQRQMNKLAYARPPRTGVRNIWP